jgi:hypothetical protein
MRNLLGSFERALAIALNRTASADRGSAPADRDGLRRCFPDAAAPADGCVPGSPAPDDGCFPARA